jgi:hypothetical protein
MNMNRAVAIKECGRGFNAIEMVVIRNIVEIANPPLRAHIAREVCEKLDWRNAKGELKAMSCRVALLRMHRRGEIELPAPRNGNGNGKPLSRQKVILPQQQALECSVNELTNLELVCVDSRKESALWNGLIDRYHYLGYTPLPGAQLRYLIRSDEGLLGAIGWGAAAWKVAPRDQWIGWSREGRESQLNKIVNNARFLILPWIRCHNLASKVLALSERRVLIDYDERYGVKPVLLETFVEQGRFRGTCYRAANWLHLGQTQGRGKCDRDNRARLPIKDLYLKPLSKGFRAQLGVIA